MKRILTLLLVLIGLNGISQVVDGINYQAVALDEDGREIPGTDINGNVLAESMFDVRFTIRSATNDGAIEYQETHTDVNTDNFGLFTVVIGHGSTTTLSPVAMLNDIDWGADKHFLEVEIDLEQDGNYKLMSNQQMMAVPYAFYALNVGDVEWGNISDVPADLLDGDNVDDADNDPTNELQDWTTLPGIPADLADGVDDVDDADNDPTNELQIISISNDTIYLTNGGFAVIPQSTLVDWTNITNIPAGISDGIDDVDDADNDPTNELQDWSTLPGIPAGLVDGIDDVNDADSDPTNELQTWSTLPGIPADLADGIDNVDDADNDPTNEITTVTDNGDGTSTITDALGGTITVDNDGIDNVDDADNDPTNELQTLSLSNDTLFLSNGGFVVLTDLLNPSADTTGGITQYSTSGIFTPGSGCEGGFISSGFDILDGVKQFDNFTLSPGHTLDIGPLGFLVLRVKDTCIISGNINGSAKNNGLGTGGGSGGAAGRVNSSASFPSLNPCTGSSGANSQSSLVVIPGGTAPSGLGLTPNECQKYNFIETQSSLMGAKGGNGCITNLNCSGNSNQALGGLGGAGLLIFCKYLVFDGTIDCSGGNATAGGGGSPAGGGGGGGVLISSVNYLSNTGSVNILGGNPAGGCNFGPNGGKGGDGWVLFITP